MLTSTFQSDYVVTGYHAIANDDKNEDDPVTTYPTMIRNTFYPVQLGSETYATIVETLTHATETNKTIKLLGNVTENVVLTNGQDVILDLNGYTLTNDGTHSTIITQIALRLLSMTQA